MFGSGTDNGEQKARQEMNNTRNMQVNWSEHEPFMTTAIVDVKVKDQYKDIVLAAFVENQYPKLGVSLTEAKQIAYQQESGYVSITIELEFTQSDVKTGKISDICDRDTLEGEQMFKKLKKYIQADASVEGVNDGARAKGRMFAMVYIISIFEELNLLFHNQQIIPDNSNDGSFDYITKFDRVNQEYASELTIPLISIDELGLRTKFDELGIRLAAI